jgi:phosphatidylcholine synthase
MRSIGMAALVHVFTACGVVCALFAVRAALAGAWEGAFAWLALALLIDGVDGTLARWAQVKRYLPRFSGDRLDLIVDYVTYVFAPVLLLLRAGYLVGNTGVILAALILLSSLFHFIDTDSKADDHCFIGFPAIWNVVAFYVFALQPRAWLTNAALIVLIGLTFVPWKWAHPLRTRGMFPVTLAIAGLWCFAALHTLWNGFPATPLASAVLLVAAAYGLGTTLVRSLLR